jgi:hypothetical protein
MKKTLAGMISKTALLMLGTAALSSMSFAITACSGALTVASLTSGGGCFVGANTFTNFTITGGNLIGGAGADAIDPSSVTVNIQYNSPNLVVVTSNNDLGSWNISGAQQFSFQLNYTVTGGGSYFRAFSDSINASTTNIAAGASLTKGVTDTTSTMFLNVNDQSPNSAMTTLTGGPFDTINISDNFDVHASNFGATLLSATNTFATPEPMTSMLLGSGLLAFGFILRRRTARK